LPVVVPVKSGAHSRQHAATAKFEFVEYR